MWRTKAKPLHSHRLDFVESIFRWIQVYLGNKYKYLALICDSVCITNVCCASVYQQSCESSIITNLTESECDRNRKKLKSGRIRGEKERRAQIVRALDSDNWRHYVWSVESQFQEWHYSIFANRNHFRS